MLKSFIRGVRLFFATVTFAAMGFIIFGMIFSGNSYGAIAIASAAPAPKTESEVAAFLADRADEDGYSSMSPEVQETWNGVSAVLYGDLKAYGLKFQLTDDPAKNCAVKYYQMPGGCYVSGRNVGDTPIFISTQGISPEQLNFIVYHEYSHHLQHIEGGTKFVADFECDADLRAVELQGYWTSGFERQCLNLGMSLESIALDQLPTLQATFAASKNQ